MQMELVFVCDKYADILNIKWTEPQKLGFFSLFFPFFKIFALFKFTSLSNQPF